MIRADDGKVVYLTSSPLRTGAWARMLVNRKKTLFGYDRRMVVSYTVGNEGNSRHLYVASTLVPD